MPSELLDPPVKVDLIYKGLRRALLVILAKVVTEAIVNEKHQNPFITWYHTIPYIASAKSAAILGPLEFQRKRLHRLSPEVQRMADVWPNVYLQPSDMP